MTEPITTLLRQFPRGEVAEAVGASERTVRRWEKGSHAPQTNHLLAIVSFLNRPEHLKRLGRRPPLTLADLVGKTEAA